MPKLKNFEVRHQFNHFTILETLAYLIPKDDPLRKQAYDMSQKNVEATSVGTCFKGKSTFTDPKGEKEEKKIDSSELWTEHGILDTNDPGFQQYCTEELALLEQVKEKYKDQPGHDLMMTYIDSLQMDTQNLKDGIATETNVGTKLIGGSRGLLKMKDVIIDLEPEDRNKKDVFQSNFKDPAVYEEAAEQLGITGIYQEYNALMKTGTAWQKAWQNGEPDPEELERIGEQFHGNIQRLDERIGTFKRQYFEDEKLPEEQRKIYNITTRDNVKKKDLIASDEDMAMNPGIRAVNGRNWETRKNAFEKTFEKQLLAAKLMKLQKEIGEGGSKTLRENTQRLIKDCLVDRTEDPKDRTAAKPLKPKEHYALLDEVRREAAGLAAKSPAARGIVEAADKYMSNPAVKMAETRSADKWIESFQKQNTQERNGEKGEAVTNADRFANIMAARMLVDSVRGNKKSLTDKPISAQDIADKAAELKNDPTYQGFLNRLNGDPKAMQKAVSAAKSGHGGALDDMFRDHVKHLPAGQLSNNPLMARYMPTAKERIEILQKHVANKEPVELEKTVAEITALRNLVHADRGKKNSLNKPIPTDPENSLQTQTRSMSNEYRFRNMVREHRAETMDLITEGHGGAMVEHFREEAQKRGKVFKDPAFRTVQQALNQNTIGGRLEAVRAEAAALRDRAESRKETGSFSLGDNMKAAALLSEYIVLDHLSRDPQTGEIDQNRLQGNIPWGTVTKNTEKGFKQNPQFTKMMQTMGNDLPTKVMNQLATQKQETFITNIGQTMNAMQEKTQSRDSVEKTHQRPSVSKTQDKQDQGPEIG